MELLKALIDFFTALTMDIIVVILIIVIAFFIVCVIINTFHKPSKFWATLPVHTWGTFFLLRICRDKYRRQQGVIMNKTAEEKMFNHILGSRWFSLRDREKARDLLERREIVYKYFSAEHFNAEDYRMLVYEYESEGVDMERIQDLLPAPLNNPKTASLFAILIKNNVLDSECQPPIENAEKKLYYYLLADIVWEKSNLIRKGSRDKSFAELWAGKSIWQDTSKEAFVNNIKNGINYANGQSSKAMKNDIMKMLKN